MREIKFRGYAVEEMANDQWIYGFGVFEIEFSEDYAKHIGRPSDFVLYSDRGEYDVVEKSIGQYTGLKDINGVEIYEGDILEYANNKKYSTRFRYQVFFRDGSFTWENDIVLCSSNLKYKSGFKVIGNIYENPELLQNDGVFE